MPFDARQGQVLAKPVSAYLEGRAMQMAYQQDKLQQKILQAQVEDLPRALEHRRQMEALDMQLRQQQLAAALAPPQPKVYGTPSTGMVEYQPGSGGAPRELLPAPAADDKQPASIKEYEYARSQGYQGTFESWARQQKAAAQPAAPAGYAWNPDGSLRKIKGGPADPGGKALTVSQQKALGFAATMQDAEDSITQLQAEPGNAGYRPNNAQLIAMATVLNPDASMLMKQAANAVLSEKAQRYMQATLQWLDPMVRARSGVATRPDELIMQAATWFPMAGDSEAVIRQKSTQRQKQLGITRKLGSRQLAGEGDEAEESEQPDPISISTDAEYDALPSGTEFLAPDGSTRIKP